MAEGKLGDNHTLPKFERGGDDFLAEGRHVVFVRVPDFFDEAVRAESFEQT